MKHNTTANVAEKTITVSGPPSGNDKSLNEYFAGSATKANRLLAIVLLPLLVGACALPVPIQIAMWAGDGISYMMSKKSLSDHGLSTLIGQDCALYRAITEGEVCYDPASDTTAIAQAPDFIDDWRAPELPQNLQSAEIGLTDLAMRSDDDANDAARYFVLGSFTFRENAEELMSLSADLSPKLIKSDDEYRVTVGPVAPPEMAETYSDIRDAGFYEIWTYTQNSKQDDAQLALIQQ